MSSAQMTQQGQQGQVGGLHMQWFEVRDERGRTHMEAHWVSDAPTPGLPHPHAA